MKTKLTIQNVVDAENVVITTYPMWSDYGCLTNAVRITTKEQEGIYKTVDYITDELDEMEAFDIDIVCLDENEIKHYQTFKKQERIKHSQLNGNSLHAEIGDTVQVYKGKKNMGLEIIVKSEYDFVDRYGRTQASYWLDENGIKVNKFNSIIIK